MQNIFETPEVTAHPKLKPCDLSAGSMNLSGSLDPADKPQDVGNREEPEQLSPELLSALNHEETILISSSAAKYRVTIAPGLVDQVRQQYPEAIYLVDDFFNGSLALPEHRTIFIHADEENKSLHRMPEIIAQLKKLGANRQTHLVAIGGGCIQDIVTFVASVYMRGLTWSYLPTTLLSMADSCIGGKSSINVLGFKNLIGNFHPPKEIIIDINVTKTLNQEQIIEGLFEAEKIAYARGKKEYLEYLESQSSAQMEPSRLQPIISQSLQAKKWFIEVDEFDKKERLLLNFGHTFGHAIEAGTDFVVSHGIAVGLGMLTAAYYSKQQSLIDVSAMPRVDALISHIKTMLEPVALIELKDKNINLFLEKFESDKKHTTESYKMVCPRAQGDLALIAAPKNEITRLAIKKAYQEALSLLGYL